MATMYCSTYQCHRTSHGFVHPDTKRPLCAVCHLVIKGEQADAEKKADKKP